MEREPRGNILIVDDEKNLCDYLSIILEKEGFSVSTSNRAEEALSMLKSNPFDLVIAEVRWKEWTGLKCWAGLKNTTPI